MISLDVDIVGFLLTYLAVLLFGFVIGVSYDYHSTKKIKKEEDLDEWRKDVDSFLNQTLEMLTLHEGSIKELEEHEKGRR
jgi:hypothetical protein